jgi:hypothetical protein
MELWMLVDEDVRRRTMNGVDTDYTDYTDDADRFASVAIASPDVGIRVIRAIRVR